MPEKVEERGQEVVEAKEEAKESANVQSSGQVESKQDAAAEGSQKEHGGEEKPEENQTESQNESKPKSRGRKSKENGEGPASKKAKEIKSPARVSTRVRNRSTGEKLPAFKDMEDELPSPTRRRAKLEEKEQEKSLEDNEPHATEATA